MRYIVLALLLVSAHFALTPFAPGPAGTAKIYWPFAADSKPWLGFAGGLPAQSGIITAFLAGLAGLGFLAAALGLFWNGIPSTWWPVLVIVAAAASILLYVLYFGVWAILPLLLDAVLLLGVFFRHWSASGLRGG
jgi:hypothetical protein